MTKQLSDGNPDGTILGQSTTDKVAFYGSTPIAQPSAAAQQAITNLTGGTANGSGQMLTITATFVSSVVGNALATLAAQTNAIRSALVSHGLIKGSS